jgi:undecaprenyl-diphosphatase
MDAVILAVVQGITEFLPISSSGHLVIFQSILGFKEPPVFYDILLHLGTLLAVVVYFRQQLWLLLTDKKALGLWTKLAVATLPAVAFGLFLESYLVTIFSSLVLVGISLIFTGGLLFSTCLIPPKKKEGDRQGDEREKEISLKDALFIGFFQALAIFPGVSRSGMTLSSGLWRGLSRRKAFSFAFLLAIPAILGAVIIEAKDDLSESLGWPAFLGVLVAGGVGYISLKLLEKILRSKKLYLFGFYCLVLGIALLILG